MCRGRMAWGQGYVSQSLCHGPAYKGVDAYHTRGYGVLVEECTESSWDCGLIEWLWRTVCHSQHPVYFTFGNQLKNQTPSLVFKSRGTPNVCTGSVDAKLSLFGVTLNQVIPPPSVFDYRCYSLGGSTMAVSSWIFKPLSPQSKPSQLPSLTWSEDIELSLSLIQLPHD